MFLFKTKSVLKYQQVVSFSAQNKKINNQSLMEINYTYGKWKVTLIGTGRSNLTSSRSCVQSSGTNVPLTMSSVFQRSVRDWSLVSGLPLCCKTIQRRWQLEIVKNCQNYQKHTLFIPSPPIKRAVLKC